MRDLPSGTVTFLFTDIEGSTRLLHELGDSYADALAEHRRNLRRAFAAHGGVEVDTQGDAFFVAFARAKDAIAAAADAQRALADGPVRVRIGLHTGEPAVTDEGYVGIDVHKGARIAVAGHGGQVLLSHSTRELLDSSFALRDLGRHTLKDFDQAVSIFQLGDGSFPPLKTISNTNLPRPASSFVGRTLEVGAVVGLVRGGARLVTLTGSGGSGKTRLALEAAVELVPEFEAGVFWVGLAPLREPALVTEAIARVLGATGDLAAHVGDGELLLLLDNFEQVVAAAPALPALLARCPNLHLLVTSRELLRVEGETDYPVPPLVDDEAVELFCVRSRLGPDAIVTELCRRLDNLPLAVELAAARARVLSPAQIHERLAQRLDLLKGGRDAVPRQQTLRATIEWSYDLLEPEERQLFARLSVFARGCTLEAAEDVVEADVDTLQSLVEKSLVRHTGSRFWMLETIREFAAERLEASAEAADVACRHAEFFVALAESANLTFGLEGAHRPDLVAAEADNMRAALSGARARGEFELALRIAVALEMYWVYTNPPEGMRWFDSLLDEEVPLELRAHAPRAYGSCANPSGDDALAERLYEQSLRAFEALGDERWVAHLLMRLGSSAMYRGDCERARDLGTRSLAMSRQVGDRPTEALALWLVGEAHQKLGNDEIGIDMIKNSADLAGEVGFTWQRARMLRRLADRALENGQPDEAADALHESLRLSHEIGDRISDVFALARLARIAAETGQPERAGMLRGASRPRNNGAGSAPGRGSGAGSRTRFSPGRDPSSSAVGRQDGGWRPRRPRPTRSP